MENSWNYDGKTSPRIACTTNKLRKWLISGNAANGWKMLDLKAAERP